MEETPLYNSRLLKNYVEYLRKFYPHIDPNDVLEYAGIESSEIEEGGQWLTQRQIDRFHEMLSQLTDNPNISREVGRFSVSGQRPWTHTQICLGISDPFHELPRGWKRSPIRLPRPPPIKSRNWEDEKLKFESN